MCVLVELDELRQTHIVIMDSGLYTGEGSMGSRTLHWLYFHETKFVHLRPGHHLASEVLQPAQTLSVFESRGIRIPAMLPGCHTFEAKSLPLLIFKHEAFHA